MKHGSLHISLVTLLSCKVLSARVGRRRLPPYFISQPLLAGPAWIAARMTSMLTSHDQPSSLIVILFCQPLCPPTSQMAKKRE